MFQISRYFTIATYFKSLNFTIARTCLRMSKLPFHGVNNKAISSSHAIESCLHICSVVVGPAAGVGQRRGELQADQI